MAPRALAHDRGLDLFCIDLPRDVSKCIGETERHLASLLGGADANLVVLFLDEADALFGRRTRLAHERS